LTAWSYNRGHKVIFINNEWVWADTKLPVKDNERPCIRCYKYPTKEGYDVCLGHIKGASSACCGHGVKKPYIIYNMVLDNGDVSLDPP